MLSLAAQVFFLPAQASSFGWQPDFAGPGFIGKPHVAVVHEGELYVAGKFSTAGKSGEPYVARWDGQRWHPVVDSQGRGLEPPEPPVTMRIYALASFNGELIVSGNFSRAGDRQVNHIVRYDGQNWLPMGPEQSPGTDGSVSDLRVWNGSLIAGGWFSSAGGQEHSGLARWNGLQWEPFSAAGGVDEDEGVSVIEVIGESLYVGGNFDSIGGQPIAGVARWNGEQWQGYAGSEEDLSGWSVRALAEFNGDLIAAGTLSHIGDKVFNDVARWDGQQWRVMRGSGDFPDPHNNGIEGWINDMAVWNGQLFVGGEISTAGGLSASGMAIWNGETWLTPETSDQVERFPPIGSFVIHDDQLLAIGAGGPPAEDGEPIRGIARLTSSGWRAFGTTTGTGLTGWSGSFEPLVRSLVSFNGELVAGGGIEFSGSTRTNSIARWNGAQWNTLSGPSGHGVASDIGAPVIRDMLVHDGTLFVAGEGLDTAGGVEVSGVARWDGHNWNAMGPLPLAGISSHVYALEIYQGSLVAAGRFKTASDTTVNGVARWDGDQWQPLSGAQGTGVSASSGSLTVESLHVHEGSLYVGGRFSAAGGKPAEGLARWDGQDWSPVPGWSPSISSGVRTEVTALGSWQQQLLVGGRFERVGEQVMNRVAAWNGSSWSALADDRGAGVRGPVYQFLDRGDELLIAGPVRAGDDTVVNGVARWDGEKWRGLTGPSGTGMGTADGFGDFCCPYVGALAVHEQSLFAAGSFATAGGVPAWNIGRYEPNPLVIDLESVSPARPMPGDTVSVSAIMTGNDVNPGSGTGYIESTGGGSCSTTELEALGAGRWRFGCEFTASDTTGAYEVTARFESDDGELESSSTPIRMVVRTPSEIEFVYFDPEDVQVTGQLFFLVAEVVADPLLPDPDGLMTMTTSQGHYCTGSAPETACLFRTNTPGELTISVEYEGGEYYGPGQASVDYLIEQAVLEFEPSRLDFGIVPVDGPPRDEYMLVSNTSGEPAQIDDLYLSFNSKGFFELNEQGSCGGFPISIPAHSGCTIGFRFAPEEVGGWAVNANLATSTLAGSYEFWIDGRARDTASPQPAPPAADAITVGPGHSAHWYDPSRSGEGWSLEILDPDTAVVYWFTYDEAGAQRWLISVGEIHRTEEGEWIEFPELDVTSGGQFGPDFDPDAVETEHAGRGKMWFADCDSGKFRYDAFGQAQTLDLERLSRTMGADCPEPTPGEPAEEIEQGAGWSGSWFDPAWAGQGFSLQWLAQGGALITWYTYDSTGNQRWMIGTGHREGDQVIFPEISTSSGAMFGAGFDPDQVEIEEWGVLGLELDCESGTAAWDSEDPEFGEGTFDLERLTRLQVPDCPGDDDEGSGLPDGPE